MTYPQQYPPQPGYPAQPAAPAYAPPQQAPQYPPQPGYPAPGTPQNYAPNTAYVQPGYAPAPQFQQPGYLPQAQFQQPGYPPQAPPQPELPPASLSDFMNQPASAGGKALAFNVPGTRYVGTVVRNITDADIEVATEVRGGGIARHPDGRPKVIMKVPLLMQPSPEFPTGIGVWYVKGNERNELLRAMEAAGAEPGPPRGGDIIDVTYTHDEPSRQGMSPRKVKRVVYTRGNGVAPELPQAQQAQAQPPAFQQPQMAQFQQPQQPAFQQPQMAQFQQPGMPDPAIAYQQATGQMPPAPQFQQPQYAQPGSPTPPPATAPAPGAVSPMSGAPATATYGFPTPGAAPAAPGFTPGAPPTAPASPSSAGGPPADWPADVPFIPGLTPDQARIAAAMHHPAAQQQ